MSQQIEKMRKLGFSDAEIADVLAADKRIDKGENLFPLSAEQEKAAQKARQADRAPTVYKFDKRERKPNEQKRDLIALIAETLKPQTDSIEILNPEREILFNFSGIKYKITLSAPRK